MADRNCMGAAARAWGALVLCLAWGGAAADLWTLRGEDGFGPGTFFGTEVDSLGRLSLTSLRGANLALGATGKSGENSLSGSRSVTDGSTDTEWRFNNRAELLGESISLDLRGDRGITRVRILPGKTINQRPRFFLKGYRLEAAAEAAPDDWVLVARQIENTRPVVDTAADSTWLEVDAGGTPLPVLGRFFRLRVAREEPPDWVTVGEIEVFGEGYRADGAYESQVLDAGEPVNFGRARIQGREGAATGLFVQFRTARDTADWSPWYRARRWSLAEGIEGVELKEPEPARFLQYRVGMETADPLAAPVLEQLEVDFERRLFAASVRAGIEPRRPVLGEETVFTYSCRVEVGEEDLGFDRIRIDQPGEVLEVRFDGVPFSGDSYRWSRDEGSLHLWLDSAHRIGSGGLLEVDFASVLLRPTHAVGAGVAGSGREPPNFQQVEPAAEEALTLVGRGIVARALPRAGIRITPNPFNAAGGTAQIRFDLAKVGTARPVSVSVHDLSGRLVRRLWDRRPAASGRKVVEWDGRDDAGALAVPGIYLLRIEVAADVGDVWQGAIGVLY